MERSPRGRLSFMCLVLMVVMIVQLQPATALKYGNKREEVSALQHQEKSNETAQNFYQQVNSEDNFSDVEDLLNDLEEELVNTTGAEGPLSLGKELRLRLREAFLNHRRRMEEIRLERRLFMESKKQEMKELLSEFNRTRNELRVQVRLKLEECKRLRQEFMNGNITKEEFKAELERVRLELRSRVELMIKLGNRMGVLMREIATKNREFALRILELNREFKQELLQTMNQAREQWRKRGR